MEKKTESVYAVMQAILAKLTAQSESSTTKALLAALRHSAGKPLGNVPSVWPLLFAHMPESFLSNRGQETKEERAIFAVLQLYAMQKQGTRGREITGKEKNIGEALRQIRTKDNDQALDRRFVSALTAQGFDEFLYRLRQLMKLAKSRGAVPVDFARLAEDLYWYQCGGAERIRLRWAESYYRDGKKHEESLYLQGGNTHE